MKKYWVPIWLPGPHFENCYFRIWLLYVHFTKRNRLEKLPEVTHSEIAVRWLIDGGSKVLLLVSPLSPLLPSAAQSFCACLIWVSYIWIYNIIYINTMPYYIYMTINNSVDKWFLARTSGFSTLLSPPMSSSSQFVLTCNFSWFLKVSCLFVCFSFCFTVSFVLLACYSHS